MTPQPREAPHDRSASAQEHLEAAERLIRKYRALEELAQRPVGEGKDAAGAPAHPPGLAELRRRIGRLHPADAAYVLENLPLEDRRLVWDLVRGEERGEILLEVSDAVRDSLLAGMDNAEIVAATQELDADEIADLAADLSDEVVQDIIEAQD